MNILTAVHLESIDTAGFQVEQMVMVNPAPHGFIAFAQGNAIGDPVEKAYQRHEFLA